MSVPDPTEAAERFVEKWSASEPSERAAGHEHFIDLCRLIGQPAPAEADPTGKDYCFEKAVKVMDAFALFEVKGHEQSHDRRGPTP